MEIDYSKRSKLKYHVRVGGRGSGKTYASAQWLADKALEHPELNLAAIFVKYLGIVGKTLGLECEYKPSRRTVQFSNGARVILHSADKPDELRGPTYDFIVGDNADEWVEIAYLNARFSCRPTSLYRPEMFMNFRDQRSIRIFDVLGGDFEGTSN